MFVSTVVVMCCAQPKLIKRNVFFLKHNGKNRSSDKITAGGAASAARRTFTRIPGALEQSHTSKYNDKLSLAQVRLVDTGSHWLYPSQQSLQHFIDLHTELIILTKLFDVLFKS